MLSVHGKAPRPGTEDLPWDVGVPTGMKGFAMQLPLQYSCLFSGSNHW